MQVRHIADVDATTYTRLMQRSASEVQRVLPQVQTIMEDVRQRGDAALRELTARFEGVDLVTIQHLLGHANLSTTAKYLHVTHKHRPTLNSPFDLLRIPTARDIE